MSFAATLRPPINLVELLLAWIKSASSAHAHARRDDLALAREVVGGSPQAQETLLKLLLPHVRAVARAVLDQTSDIDDAVQVATLEVLDDLPNYRGDARIIRWARKISARACLRLKAKQHRWHRNVGIANASASTHTTPEYDLPRDVAGTLQRLPTVQREAVVLRHVLGHTVAEVSELTEAPIDTVKSRLLAGRRTLREMLRVEAKARGIDR